MYFSLYIQSPHTDSQGWKQTALSHLVFPIRMRPSHPLDRPKNTLSSPRKHRKRRITPITRARRRKIDPTMYGAVHLTEEMLAAEHVVIAKEESRPVKVVQPPKTKTQTKRVEKEESDLENDDFNPYQAEKANGLSILAQMFAGKEEWDGREDEAVEEQIISEVAEEDEEVRIQTVEGPPSTASESSDIPKHLSEAPSEPQPAEPAPMAASTRLKDLFAMPAQGSDETALVANC